MLCCVAAAFAQSNDGSISGRILDQDNVVSGAPIEAKNIQTGAVFKTTSRTNGNYDLEQLPPGKYELTIGVAGFEKSNATVQPAQGVTVDCSFSTGLSVGNTGRRRYIQPDRATL